MKLGKSANQAMPLDKYLERRITLKALITFLDARDMKNVIK